jgi:hypothetical protein
MASSLSRASMYKRRARRLPDRPEEEVMKHRLSFVAVSVVLLLSACASMPAGDDSCQPPAYCGSQKTYDHHGQG